MVASPPSGTSWEAGETEPPVPEAVALDVAGLTGVSPQDGAVQASDPDMVSVEGEHPGGRNV